MAENIPVRPLAKDKRFRGPPPPKAPRHLSADSRRLWDSITTEWVLSGDALPILRATLEQRDLYDRMRRQVWKEGATIVNPKSGLVKPHPAVRIMHDSLTQFRLGFRALGLEPPEVT